MPPQLATICGVIDEEKDVPVGSKIPKRTSNTAVKMRCSRRPTPGKPFAKVEKSRCKTSPDKIVRKSQRNQNRSKLETAILLLGEIQFDDAALQADGYGMGAVVRA